MTDDFALLAAAHGALERTSTLAECATMAFAKTNPGGKRQNVQAVRTVRTIVARYCEIVTSVATAASEYDETMSEAQLRAWARGLVETMR